MPSEVSREDTQARVAPEPGKGALGTRRPWIVTAPRHRAGYMPYSLTHGKSRNKPEHAGVYAGQCLSLASPGKAPAWKCARAEARTGLGKSDRPGSQGGLGKRRTWRK
jgi:hypothetical protein